MKLYRFECSVWLRGESVEDALKELRDELGYHFGLDNNLIAFESDAGVLVDEEGESRPEDRPSPTYVSARESAIDAQAAEYGDMD